MAFYLGQMDGVNWPSDEDGNGDMDEELCPVEQQFGSTIDRP